ncbi:MAG: transketolase [Elusimicrobia bacterium]|nr:transketolase [Elusimicrobiota bacterium]
MNQEQEDVRSLEAAAKRARGRLVEISHRNKVAHLGSSLSCVDIVLAAYGGGLRLGPGLADSPERDIFLLSKGHAAAALYAVLAEFSFLTLEQLYAMGTSGSPLGEHPTRGSVPGVEITSGSLGHGLSMGTGWALGAALQGRPSRVVVLMSDGECNEGVVWEAAMFAAARRQGNLAVIVDFNAWQATGRSREVLALEPLCDKWTAFGWAVREIDGHDLGALRTAMAGLPSSAGKPTALIAHTVKGKGVSFMEDDNDWHYRIPSADDLLKAKQELGIP